MCVPKYVNKEVTDCTSYKKYKQYNSSRDWNSQSRESLESGSSPGIGWMNCFIRSHKDSLCLTILRVGLRSRSLQANMRGQTAFLSVPGYWPERSIQQSIA